MANRGGQANPQRRAQFVVFIQTVEDSPNKAVSISDGDFRAASSAFLGMPCKSTL